MKIINGNVRVISKEENYQYFGDTIDEKTCFYGNKNTSSNSNYKNGYSWKFIKIKDIIPKSLLNNTAVVFIAFLVLCGLIMVLAMPILIAFTAWGIIIWIINKLKK